MWEYGFSKISEDLNTYIINRKKELEETRVGCFSFIV